jgi:hypothetical protein
MEEKREMNLFELIIACGRGIKRFFGGCINLACNSFRLAIQYFFIVIPVLAFFVFYGLHSTHPSKLIYKGRTTIQFMPETRMMIKNSLDGLNTLKNLDLPKFAQELNISEIDAKNLRFVDDFLVIDCKNDSVPDAVDYKRNKLVPADTINPAMNDRFALQIELKGATNFNVICDGLKYYFNSQKDIVRVDSMSKAVLKERIAMCDRELDRLDRFSEYDYFGGGKTSIHNSWKNGFSFEPSRENLYYVNMRDLLHEKNYLTAQLVSTPDVINFSSDVVKLVMTPRYVLVIFWTILGLGIGLLFALIFKRRKNIWSYLKDKNY